MNTRQICIQCFAGFTEGNPHSYEFCRERLSGIVSVLERSLEGHRRRLEAVNNLLRAGVTQGDLEALERDET